MQNNAGFDDRMRVPHHARKPVWFVPYLAESIDGRREFTGRVVVRAMDRQEATRIATREMRERGFMVYRLSCPRPA